MKIVKVVLYVTLICIILGTVCFASTGAKDTNGTKYEEAVSILMELEIMNEYSEGTFLPLSVVTRAEMAKILVTTYGLSQAAEVFSGATPFSDVTGNWAEKYIKVASDYGLLSGYDDGTFKPNETITYAEAVEWCIRTLGYTKVVEAQRIIPDKLYCEGTRVKINQKS